MNPAMRFLTANAWALTPTVFDALCAIIESHARGEKNQASAMDLGSDEPATQPAMQIIGDAAVIPVVGVLARYSSQVNGMCQDHGRSAESLQADLQAALVNPNVRRVILRIDSPGGSVAGTAETGDMIRRVSAAGKPVIAFVDGAAYSAAYWLASQCDQIIASADTAGVGSIGVLTTMLSRAADTASGKLLVVRSTPLKAVGVGPITDEQLASVQRSIDDIHEAFAIAVQAGRGLTDAQIATIATGELFVASKAIAMGMVDGIASFDDVLNGGQQTNVPPSTQTYVPTISASTRHQGKTTMKLTAQALAALIVAESAHAALISQAAIAGDDEPAICAKIAAAKTGEAQARIVALEQELSARDAALAEAKAKHDAETAAHAKTAAALTLAQGKQAKLAALATVSDPGGSPTETNTAGLTGEAKWRAEFAASARLQAELDGDADAYVAMQKLEAKHGRANIRQRVKTIDHDAPEPADAADAA